MTMHCHHGYETLCPLCPRESALRDRERVKEGTYRYYVLAHRGDGKYRAQDAIGGKEYRRESAAEKFAESLNSKPYPPDAPRGYVVRLCPVPKLDVPAGGALQ